MLTPMTTFQYELYRRYRQRSMNELEYDSYHRAFYLQAEV